MPQTPAWRAPENIFSSSNTFVPPSPLSHHHHQTMAPARAVVVSIYITTGACSLCWLPSLPMAGGFTHTSGLRLSLSLFLLEKSELSLSLLLDFGLDPTSLAFYSLLSAFLLTKSLNMRMKAVTVVYVHICLSASPVSHCCVTAFLPALVIIGMVAPLSCRLHWACRYHPRLQEPKLTGKLRAEKQVSCHNV